VPLSAFVERALDGRIITPLIPKKNTNKERGVNDSGYSVPGNIKSIKDRLSSPYTEQEGILPKKMAIKPDSSISAPIVLSEEDKMRAHGILRFQPELMKHIDEDHIAYDRRTWDVIGTYHMMNEAVLMRQKAWQYYHCTAIIIEDGYTVIAQEPKDYVQQPGLNAIRSLYNTVK
jgi:hypothetical protein